MNKKQKYFIFIALIFIVLASANFTFALEINYPNFPGAPVITSNSEFPDLIRYFFSMGIAFSGAIALISLAIAGVQLIIGQANPEGVSNAKDRIKGSLLGLALLMVSFLIIQSINPVLIEPNISPLSSVPGIFLVKNNKQTTCPPSQADVNSISSDFMGGDIAYRCASPTEPDLLIWIYQDKDFKIPLMTKELSCNNSYSIPATGSFKIAYKAPGVYIFKDAGCPTDGYRSNVLLTSGKLPDGFENVKGSVQFVNNTLNNDYYGAVLHQRIEESGGGECQYPILSIAAPYSVLPPQICQNININNVSSASVFVQNYEPLKSGDGIDFYSGAYGWDTKGSRAGIFELKKSDIPGPWGYDPITFIYNYDGSDVSIPEQTSGPNFKVKQGSIRIKGNYIVALFSKNGNGYCQIFKKNVVDLKGTEYISKDSKSIEIVYVIPTK